MKPFSMNAFWSELKILREQMHSDYQANVTAFRTIQDQLNKVNGHISEILDRMGQQETRMDRLLDLLGNNFADFNVQLEDIRERVARLEGKPPAA